MYPGKSPSFIVNKFLSSADLSAAHMKGRPSDGDEIQSAGSFATKASGHGVRVRGFGGTPGTLRDNQVDAPLESGEPGGRAPIPDDRAFRDPDSARQVPVAGATDPRIESSQKQAKSVVAPNLTPALIAVSSFIGRVVQNPAGDVVGTVRELILNMNSGTIVFAIISVTGVLGEDNAVTSLPWKSLRMKDDGPIVYDSLAGL